MSGGSSGAACKQGIRCKIIHLYLERPNWTCYNGIDKQAMILSQEMESSKSFYVYSMVIFV